MTSLSCGSFRAKDSKTHLEASCDSLQISRYICVAKGCWVSLLYMSAMRQNMTWYYLANYDGLRYKYEYGMCVARATGELQK